MELLKKKVLSMLLCVALLCSLSAQTAFAEAKGGVTDSAYESETNTQADMALRIAQDEDVSTDGQTTQDTAQDEADGQTTQDTAQDEADKQTAVSVQEVEEMIEVLPKLEEQVTNNKLLARAAAPVGVDEGLKRRGVTGWRMSDDSTLEIEASGTISAQIISGEMPWYDKINDIRKVVIKGDVTSIGENVFCDCVNLLEIELPDTVTYIGESAFKNCEKLTTVHLPQNLEVIDFAAFSHCGNLKLSTLPDSVRDVAASAFEYCDNLTLTSFPQNIQVGEGAFYHCTGITSLRLPEKMIAIFDEMFTECTSLSSIEIPSGVKEITFSAFKNCSSLTTVTFEGKTPPVRIDDNAFDGCNIRTIRVPAGTAAAFEPLKAKNGFSNAVIVEFGSLYSPSDRQSTLDSSSFETDRASTVEKKAFANTVQLPGGEKAVSTIGGVYNVESVEGVAVITQKKDVYSAVGLSNEEVNAGTNVALYVSDCLNKKTNQALNDVAVAANKKVAAYLIVDMYTITQKGVVNKVRETEALVELLIGVPQSVRSTNRQFSVICLDPSGNVVTYNDMDTNPNTITIHANVFGNYAVVY